MTRTVRWSAAVGAGARGALDGSRGQAGVRRRSSFAPREHISIVGNTLAERMQYDGWLETMLHARFPKHELVIRNLGFSGDEIATRPRSKNFGTPDEWLSGVGAPIGGRRRTGSPAPTPRPMSCSRSSATTSRTPDRPVWTPSRSNSATGSRTRWRSATTARRRRDWCCSHRSRTKTWAIPICRTGRRTTSGWRSTRARWRTSPGRTR